jgi:hypothetical protein
MTKAKTDPGPARRLNRQRKADELLDMIEFVLGGEVPELLRRKVRECLVETVR